LVARFFGGEFISTILGWNCPCQGGFLKLAMECRMMWASAAEKTWKTRCTRTYTAHSNNIRQEKVFEEVKAGESPRRMSRIIPSNGEKEILDFMVAGRLGNALHFYVLRRCFHLMVQNEIYTLLPCWLLQKYSYPLCQDR